MTQTAMENVTFSTLCQILRRRNQRRIDDGAFSKEWQKTRRKESA